MHRILPSHRTAPLMSSSAHTCLGCDTPFNTRKQLSAHSSRCLHYREFTDQVFERKRKSSKLKHAQDEKRPCQMSTAGRRSPSPRMDPIEFDQAADGFEDAGPAVPFDDHPDFAVSYSLR